jgi:DNA transformation protein and related proteins
MPVTPAFRDYVLDLLAPLRPTAKRMFGGFGVMLNGTMFALLTRDELYFRVDDTTRPRFDAAGCSPFGYNRAGRDVVIASYYAAPPDLYDQPEELLAWARQAADAAQRTAKRPRTTGRPARRVGGKGQRAG